MNDWPFKTLDRQVVGQIYDDYHEGLFILDKDARIVYYNKKIAQMDGYDPQEAQGRLFTDVYDLNHLNSVSLSCVVTQSPVTNRALVYRTRQGMVVNAYCNSYPFFENGQFAGAFCFSLDYSLSSTALEDLTRNYLANPLAKDRPPESALKVSHTFASLIGRSESFKAAVDRAKVAALHGLPIMLVGETGSGKELFAQAIHNRRPGRRNRFMAVNCAAIPETLLESLLFGTAKGAFTGALDKAGLFEAAEGGSIFLDEINSMPLALQSKLLRVLQEKRIARVGSTKELEVNCQVISATSRNPSADIADQRLRPDLFYRLGAIMINIPPLRHRPGDIRVLCEYFIKKHGQTLKSWVKGLSPEALNWLETQIWPGNVRELEHALTSAMIFAKNETWLRVEDFSPPGLFPPPPPTPRPVARADKSLLEGREPTNWETPLNHIEAKKRNEEEEKERIIATMAKTGGHKVATATILGLSPQLLNTKLKKYGLNHKSPEGEDEREEIRRALEKTGGHKSAAAAILGFSRQLLYSKMKKYDLN